MAPDLDEAVALEARHLSGWSATVDEHVLVFLISDGEQAVEISHEFGEPEDAARHFEQLASAASQHAEKIRAESRRRLAWT